jgi:drug/metabolite transporter (DMT)-like permease
MKIPRWLLLATMVPILWGVGGALIEIPEKWIHPTFPSTLGYVAWAFTMASVAVFALTQGPAYIIFPIICLSPVVTIVLSATLGHEKTHALAPTGIVLSLFAIFFLSLHEVKHGTPVADATIAQCREPMALR